jgi:Zn-dependent M28 family amino/carboxypeptidase
MDELVKASLARGRSYELLSELCRAAPHRLSGSEGAERAVAWAEDAMRRCGLARVRRESVRVPRWVRGDTERLFRVDANGLPNGTYPVLALGGSVATPPGGVTAEVIAVQSFEELAALGSAARGKIVLFDRPMPRESCDCFEAYGAAVGQRAHGAVEAGKIGAAAALVRSMTMRSDDFPHTGSMRYDPGVPQIPAAAISTRGADDLAARIRAGERPRVNLQLACRTYPDVESANVVGDVVGSELPDEIVLLGGHLDAWDVGEGAHDDGAGCVHALEAARLIVERGVAPKRTIRVVMFMNEENGVRGGEGYFAAHQAELGRHVLAFESDAGGFTPRGFSTDAPPEALAILKSIAARLGAASASSMESGWGGVDISPLARAGVPLVGFRPDDERYFDHHHSERDTLDAVHPRELALGAGAISAFAWAVANLDGPLPRNAAPAAPNASH